MKPTDRLGEAAKQTSIAYDDLRESGDVPAEIAESIGTLGDRLRRAAHAVGDIGNGTDATVVPTADPSKDNELVEAVREAKEDTHAVDREYLRALEILTAYHAFDDEGVPVDDLVAARRLVANRTGVDAPVAWEGGD